jgi:hypothetical protein
MIAGLPAIKGHCCVRTQFPDSSLSAFGCDTEARSLALARQVAGLNSTPFLAVNKPSRPSPACNFARSVAPDPGGRARIQPDAPDERTYRND